MKEFLSRENVPYQEKNVAVDRQAAQEMVNMTGQMGVPVTYIAGEAIVGFNQPALRQAVARLKAQPGGQRPSGIRLGAQVASASQVRPGERPGALLGTIQPGSLAEQAGLQKGDVIISVTGVPVGGADDLARALKEIAARNIKNPQVTYLRDGIFQNTTLPV